MEKPTAIKLNYLGLIGAGFGVLSLMLSFNFGLHLNDLNEYQVCLKHYFGESCHKEFYKATERQPQKAKLINYHNGNGWIRFILAFSGTVVCLGSTGLLKKYAVLLEALEEQQEYWEEVDLETRKQQGEIEQEFDVKFHKMQREMDFGIKARELEETYYQVSSYEQLDAQLEEENAKQAKLNDYRKMEGLPINKTSENSQESKPKLSDDAQSFLSYLEKNNHQEITVSKAAKNKGMKHDEVRALMQELYQAEKGIFDEATSTFKLNDN